MDCGKQRNRPINAPQNWIMNATKRHGPSYYYDLRGRIRTHKDCLCAACLIAKTDLPEIVEGDPVQVHDKFDIDMLKERDIVGLYCKEDNSE